MLGIEEDLFKELEHLLVLSKKPVQGKSGSCFDICSIDPLEMEIKKNALFVKPNTIGAMITIFERSRIKPSSLLQCCQGGCKYGKQESRCTRWKKIELCRTFSVFLFRFPSICQRPRPQCVCVLIHRVFYGIWFRTQFNFFGSWSFCWRQHGSKHSGQVIPLSVVFRSIHILCPLCVLTAERGAGCCHAERMKPLFTVNE